MKILPKREAGMSVAEVIVGLSVACLLAAMALFWLEQNKPKPSMTQVLSNMRMLHLVAQSMELDGITTGDTNLAWPGDMDGRFSTWVKKAVPDYLLTNDLHKLVSVPGLTVKPGRIPLMAETAVRMYGVSSNSTSDVVFLTSANFTNRAVGGGGPLDPAAKPFGDKGFVVFRKGGDGMILIKNEATNARLIGGYAPMLVE